LPKAEALLVDGTYATLGVGIAVEGSWSYQDDTGAVLPQDFYI